MYSGDSLKINEVQNYWFNEDGHWNQKGSDLFAEKFSNYIKAKHKLKY